MGSGEAIINFRANDSGKKQPFIAMQAASYSNYAVPSSILDKTGYVGPNDSLPQSIVSTMVMWWGEDMDGVTPKLQLFTSDNVAVADGTGEYTMESRTYPFLDTLVSQYTVHLDKETLDGAVEYGGSEGARLDYYKNDKLLRQEALSFRLCNLRGAGTVEDSKALLAELQGMGRDFGTSAKTDETVTQDEWVSMAIELAGGGNYTASNKELFQMQVAPTIIFNFHHSLISTYHHSCKQLVT